MPWYSTPDGGNRQLFDEFVTITPSDSTVFDQPYFGIYCGSEGTVKVDSFSGTGTEVKFEGVQPGQILPIIVKRVYATDTTAGPIIGLRHKYPV